MQRLHKWSIVLLAIVTAGLLAACSQAPKTQPKSQPARVERVAGSDPKVILTNDAAQRLDIKTEMARTETGTQVAIPYTAVMYDLKGDAWAYTSPEPLTFVRKRVTIQSIQGNTALLTDGLSSGTPVVTLGAAELYGVEFGIGK